MCKELCENSGETSTSLVDTLVMENWTWLKLEFLLLWSVDVMLLKIVVFLAQSGHWKDFTVLCALCWMTEYFSNFGVQTIDEKNDAKLNVNEHG